MSPSSTTIWKRRAVLMAIVGVLVAIPLTIAVRGGDDGDGDVTDGQPATATDEPPAPVLGSPERDSKLDIELSVPDEWSKRRQGEVLLLESADKRARVAISAPGPAADADQLHDEVVDGFQRKYASFDVTDRVQRAKVGGLKARTTAARGKQKKSGEQIGVLISTAAGDKRAYLVVAFTPIADPGQSGLEAQAVLNELDLKG